MMQSLTKKLTHKLAHALLKDTCPHFSINSTPFTADVFFDLWEHIHQNRVAWQDCDVLLTCSMTHLEVKRQFPDKNVILITDASHLYSFYLSKNENKMECIGILSPDLCSKLFQNQSLLIRFIQLCSRAIIMVVPPNTDIHDRLLMLHATGLQQIQTILTKNKELVSQTYMPTGEYFYFSQSPVLANNVSWTTQVCYRMIHLNPNAYPWRINYGQIIQDKQNGLKAKPNQYALALMQPAIHSATQLAKIEAQFIWTEQSKPEAGHASLVSCYTGPSDTNMYTVLLNLTKALTPQILLYKNNGEWILMGSRAILPEEFIQHPGFNSINLWLEVSPTQIMAGTGNKVLLEVNDTELPRAGCFGIRFIGDDIAISNLGTATC